MASVIYGKCYLWQMYYAKCNYGKSIYGKSIMANETEPSETPVLFSFLMFMIPWNFKLPFYLQIIK